MWVAAKEAVLDGYPLCASAEQLQAGAVLCGKGGWLLDCNLTNQRAHLIAFARLQMPRGAAAASAGECHKLHGCPWR